MNMNTLRKIALSLFIVSFLFIIGYKLIKFHVTVFGEDGNIIEDYDKNLLGSKNGLSKTYDLNGNITRKLYYKNGHLSGPDSTFYDSGQLKILAFWNKGLQTDSLVEFYKNGREKGKVFFHEGKRNGQSINFYENGTIREKYHFKNDLMNGVGWMYNSEGLLEQSYFAVEDTLYNIIEYNDSSVVAKFFFKSNDIELTLNKNFEIKNNGYYINILDHKKRDFIIIPSFDEFNINQIISIEDYSIISEKVINENNKVSIMKSEDDLLYKLNVKNTFTVCLFSKDKVDINDFMLMINNLFF
jgi:antitoxin component YwqK of YwqJK toxin-antitoxin module